MIDSLAEALGIQTFQLFVDPADLPPDGAAAVASIKLFLDDLSRQIEGFSNQVGKKI